MAESNQRNTGQPQNYKFDRGGMSAEFGPFIGIVKDNIDPTHQGRLKVYIEQFGGSTPDDKALWRTVSYCTPFYGSTPPNPGKKGDSNSEGKFLDSNPHSYGMWFTPPDLEVQVLCFFVAGDPNQGYYFGCIPQQGINHMIPAIGASASYKTDNKNQASYFEGAETLPVTEINPLNKQINDNPKFWDQTKPVHSIVAAEMFQQGTIADRQRGPIGSSSQRESPSGCYGISTPGRPIYQGGEQVTFKLDTASPSDVNVIGRQGGHSLVMDDGDLYGQDALFRIRSASGHQITLSDDGNFIYIIHANGQTWLEFGQEGTIDLYATNSVNVRTQGTINLHADQDINMYAGGNISMKSNAKMSIESATTMSVSSVGGTTIYSQAKIGVLADGSLALVSKNGSWNAGPALALVADGIDLNDVATESVDPPDLIATTIMPDTEFDSSVGWTVTPGKLESIVNRAPTHEPYPYHNQGIAVSVSMEEGQPGVPPNTPDIPDGWSVPAS